MATKRERPVGQFPELDTYRCDYAFKCALTPSTRDTTGDEYKPIKISAVATGSVAPTVALSGSGEAVNGMVLNIVPGGDACRVDLEGPLQFLYTGSAASIGTMVKLVGSATAGKVVASTPTLGAKMWEVVNIDVTNTIIEVKG